MTTNKRPPRHRPVHWKPKAEQLRVWRGFYAALHLRPSAAARSYDISWREPR